ncbi:MAG: tRNA pseudouridine(38-40) synthase TruA [Bacteroidetes bacterium]|nr:tRNA pseudouridine(38-40) synthase TruA [Bacteroidota bacterium]
MVILNHRYFIKLSYDGTNYHGWQKQPGDVTVQETLEEALNTILREDVNLTGAGRTDTGVHAREYFAHFDTKLSPEKIAKKNLVFKLNSILPKDIAIHEIFSVKNDAHARFDAISRTYHYQISTKKDPFLQGRAWINNRPLDIEKMQAATKLLFKHTDFTSFSKSNTQTKTNNCKIISAEWIKDEHLLIFKITADRFLRNMVRAIVGTLVDVGLGKISISDFDHIIKAKSRTKAGYSVPACGLFLEKIEYPADYINKE